jgi:hypothetical protein
MPAWNDLVEQFTAQETDAAKTEWLVGSLRASLQSVRHRRGNRNVLFYASAFLQKPQVQPALLQLTHEEINGFMSCIYGMNWDDGLTVLLHTPGGVTNAAESVVAYLCSKFRDIEVIVPAYAMSAGTMISLASNRLIMGRQSQLGPIDPQMPMSRGFVSARAIVDQFERAKTEILANRDAAHVWAPVLQALGPALLVEAQNALDYGERMVGQWLAARMFAGQENATHKGIGVARYFNDAGTHKSHGRRIDRDEARSQGVIVEDLEADQTLQEAVLTAYHLMTLIFEQTPAAKVIASHHDRRWIKSAN